MRRLLGIVLILHGLAHAGAGMWSVGASPIEAQTVWWIAAMGGFVLVGCALLGARVAFAYWQPALLVAIAASVALLAQQTHPVAVVGLAIDLFVLKAWFRWRARVSGDVRDLTALRPAQERAEHEVAASAT